MKKCRKCSTEKPKTEYTRHTHTRDRLRHECKACERAYRRQFRASKGPQYDRKEALKRFYKMTLQDYEDMLSKQDGLCGICGTDEPGGRWNILCVDHDHKTGKVRGLLCSHCNSGLGHFKDSVESLAAAINYVLKSKRLK